ncbi:TPA: restriction endonuclease subunit S [Haemophilus influenzae]
MKNNRTFLEKLLDGAEVEWKPLDEVANIVNNARKPVKSSLRVSGNIPYYGANNIQDYVEGYTHEGEFVLIAEDGSASLENYSIQWAVGKFWANNHVHVVNGKEKLNNRFLYHYLTNMNFIPFLAGKERAKLTKAKLQQIPIPIPPPSVQTEIVKILDALTALTSELTSELILRQKQYEYYREKLLDGAEVKWIPLGDVADYEQPTKYLVNSTVYNDNYPTPVLTAGKTFILGYTNEDEGIYFASKSPVIIFDDFTTANKWVDFDFKAKSSAMKMITSKNEKFALLKYIYYWLNTLPNNQTDGDHKRQWISNYANKLIPIPPLSVQTEIVKILDKFETLTNSITEGLPLAIEQSQKRYEYYRELLLNFKQ